MANKKHRIPKTKDLGFGKKIFIKQVHPDILKAMNCSNLPGCWMVDDMTIYLDKTINYQYKMETYFHELIHAVTDIEVRSRGAS